MKNSPTSSSKEGGKHLSSLIKQFKNLQKQWESLEKSRPKNPRTCYTGSDSCSILTTSFDLLFETSPRMLMSTLQQSISPSDGELSVKNCDNAVGEIPSDRRAAIMSGRLKGRRLFSPEEEADLRYGGGSGGGICSDGLSMVREKKVRVKECDQLSVGFNRSCCSVSDSCLSEEKVVMEEKMVVEVAKVVDGGGGRRLRGGGGGGRWMAAMAWFGFVLIMFTAGLISISCNGDEMILLPT